MSRTCRCRRSLPSRAGTDSFAVAIVPPSLECRHDSIDIVDAPRPRATARALQRCPEAAVVGQSLVGREPGIAWPVTEQRLARRRIEGYAFRTHEIDRAGERVAVDHDLNEVLVPNAPDGAIVQRLRPNVADAGAAREPGEPAVGDQGHVFAPRQVTERSGDLRGLLDAGS